MSHYYVETLPNGNEQTVYTYPEFRCGDAPECHDEENPCGCPKD